MAAPISHIIYAKKYFDKYPSTINKDEFILGCSFPDIRRIDDGVQREVTHLKFDPLDLNFDNLTAFQAGWKFHLYCDMKREEILNKYNFYELSDTEGTGRLSAKFLEDEIIYDANNNWEKLVHYFNNAPPTKNGIGVSWETFALWYAILAKYIEKKPDNKAIRVVIAKQLSLAKKTDAIIGYIDKLRENKKVIELLRKVTEEIV